VEAGLSTRRSLSVVAGTDLPAANGHHGGVGGPALSGGVAPVPLVVTRGFIGEWGDGMIWGNAVGLRVAEAVDAPLIAGWLNDPEFNGEFERFDQVTLGQMQKELGGDNDGRWMLVEERDGAAVGYVNHGRAAGRLWIGYSIVPAARGRGYASEAAQLLVDYLFLHEQAERIQAETHPENLASRRVLEKAGFRLEGRLRSTVFSRGAWRDSLLFSLLRSEWGTPHAVVAGRGR
jgi:RimJ/RimL family protein N-acetyltransferase